MHSALCILHLQNRRGEKLLAAAYFYCTIYLAPLVKGERATCGEGILSPIPLLTSFTSPFARGTSSSTISHFALRICVSTAFRIYSTYVNRFIFFPSRSISSFHIETGRTQIPPSPYSARYTTNSSNVSECFATPSTSYSIPLKCLYLPFLISIPILYHTKK